MGLRIRVGAICLKAKDILLVEHEKKGQRYFLLPGGGMQEGEPAERAIVREVLEETAVEVKPVRLICVCESISPGRTRHIVHFLYACDRVSGEPGQSQDPRVRRSLFAPAESLNQLNLRPPVQRWLQQRLQDGFLDETEYLGALWSD
jgi:ADP-ribose pyrophosphatase YjhB (NUDIX family)